jgi:hypothetical protein
LRGKNGQGMVKNALFTYLKRIDDDKELNSPELNVAEQTLIELIENEKLAEAS